MKTSVEVMMAEVMPPMASTVATMASSTTVPMASTSAKRVSRLIEKPANERKANVPTSDTRIEMVGISVERISCRKT